MRACCEKEVETHIRRDRDAVNCDQCGSLILAYGNPIDYQKMVKQLKEKKLPFETALLGSLQVVIKASF